MSTQPTRTAVHRDIEPAWLRPKEWRQATGMPHTTTQRLLRSGEIRSVKVGENYYIPREELSGFFARAAKSAA